MHEPPHPFARLSPEKRRDPEIVDAWLMDLSHRWNSASRTPEAGDVIPVQWRRMGILALLLGTITGLIKPEVGVKLIGLSLGIG